MYVSCFARGSAVLQHTHICVARAQMPTGLKVLFLCVWQAQPAEAPAVAAAARVKPVKAPTPALARPPAVCVRHRFAHAMCTRPVMAVMPVFPCVFRIVTVAGDVSKIHPAFL